MTMHTDTCAACGLRIIAVKRMGPPINLDYVWKHVSRRANRNHRAVPISYLKGENDDE